jgi:purine-nucleoside phosphorylase
MSAAEKPAQMPGEYECAEEAAAYLRACIKMHPHIAVVLGSGLGAFADELCDAVHIDFRDIPRFPQSTVAGHSGRMVVGKLEDVAVAVMQGRVHLYEGYSAHQVAFPTRVLGRLGVKAVVLTNASGGINASYKAGCLVVLKDHINLQGANPLVGPNDERFGPRFPDVTHAYTRQYRELALAQARRLGIDVHEGVYVGLTGPSYETPAEIRAFRAMGADVVGMSTVAEAIVARHMGMKILAVSCVANLAADLSNEELSHAEVLAVMKKSQGSLVRLLKAIVPRIEEDLRGGIKGGAFS